MRSEKHPTRVLIVDDEPLFRWALAETLHDDGYDVAEAGDGDSTIARIVTSRHAPFDVVLLDYHLPDSNDLELLSLVKHASPATAVVVMSAFATDEMRAGALARGAKAVISKPFDVTGISTLVDDAASHTRH